MPTITPNEAAKRTGRSRRTIMRAIEAREIEAHRDNRNQWRISEGALAQWALSEQPMPAAIVPDWVRAENEENGASDRSADA